MFKHLNTRIPKRIEQEKDKVSAVMIPLIKLHVLLERASGPLADPYRTGHGRPLGSPASNSLETPCSAPSEGNVALPPPPSSLRKGDEGAYNKSRDSP